VVLPFADKLEHTPGSTAQTMAKIRKTLDIVGLGFWSPGEWWAVKYVEGLFMGLAVGFFPLILGAPAVLGLVLGIGVLFGWPQLALASEVSKAEKHKRDVVYQLVYGLDLMSLMMEAGAGTFQECLQAVAMEVPESALGQEFSRVDARMDQGSTQQEALNELDERLLDPDIQSMVLSVNTSEEKGSKLKDTLGNLTEQMRQRRIQWLEKAAEEAKVHITWPAMCVMLTPAGAMWSRRGKSASAAAAVATFACETRAGPMETSIWSTNRAAGWWSTECLPEFFWIPRFLNPDSRPPGTRGACFSPRPTPC